MTEPAVEVDVQTQVNEDKRQQEQQRLEALLVDQDDAMHCAVKAGDMGDVEFLVKHGASTKGMLHLAADRNQLGVVTALVRLGVDVDARDKFGATALMLAAEYGHTEVAIELIRAGANINVTGKYGKTAMMLAAMFDKVEVVAELVRAGADANVTLKNGETALSLAAEFGHKVTLDALVRLTMFDSLSPSDGEVALFVAAAVGDVEELRVLVAKGVDIEFATPDDRTALFFAAEYERTDAVQFLLDSGASANVKSRASNSHSRRECETPLTLAGRHGYIPVFETLVRAGASVNVRIAVDGETPLISIARVDHFPAVSLLIAHGNGSSVLCFEVVQDDEYPLLPGSLATMETLCAAVAFEFEPVCVHMIARLQMVCVALQQQANQQKARQQQHHQDSTAVPSSADQAPTSEHSDALVTFACILYRACRLLFEIEKKDSALSRFVASRAIQRRIDDIDVELSSFARMHSLVLVEAASAAGALLPDGTDDSLQRQQQVQTRFKHALRSDDALDSVDSTKHATAVLLQYELALRRREQNPHAQASVVEAVLARFLRVHKMDTAPDVPIWFISRDDLEYHDWNKVKTDYVYLYMQRFTGKWRGTSVTIDGSYYNLESFVQFTTQWHALNHPNVVKLLGACHIGDPILRVYESTPNDLPLHQFLRISESNRALTWKLLYDAALGLQYLHRRGVAHKSLQSETIIVGADKVARLSHIGVPRGLFDTKKRLEVLWMAPEQLQDLSISSAASDIFAFSMCVWEAVMLELPWMGMNWHDISDRVKRGIMPKRPASMRADEWTLINEMRAHDPSKRVDIAHVMRRLKQFMLEPDQVGHNGDINREHTSSSADNRSKLESKRLDKHYFDKLGRTIPKALKILKMDCDDLPDDEQWLSTNVLPALEFVFGQLQEREMTPIDAEVKAFVDVLGRLQRFVRYAHSDKSVYQQMRSRKVAETHRVVYDELDQLLDMLHVPEDHSIRVWRLEMASSIVSNNSETPAAVGNDDADKSSSNAIMLNHLDTLPDIREQWMQEGLIKAAASALSKWRPSWYLSLRELVFSKADKDTLPDIHERWTRDGLVKAATSAPSTWRPSWYLSLRELVFSETDKIGQGAFGAVYKGKWGDAQVVIKFMGYDDDLETVSTDLLLHEVRVWHRLNHPHVLKLFGACHVDKRYFVCELASGGDLIDYLNTQPDNTQLKWLKLHEAALGLQYLHSVGIAHNDLKCDNIMIGADGKAKLIDFGLSALLGEAEIQINVNSIGAVHWRSPEYLAGGRPSCASDVYAFAMCIIEVVTGDFPWGKQTSEFAIKFQQKKGNLPPLPASVTAKQRNLLELMTTFEPTKRVSIAFVVNKLHEIANDENADQAP